jgi:hypothetical protein
MVLQGAIVADATDPTPLTRQMRMDDREIAGRLVFLRFVQQDAELLKSLRPWAQRSADQFLTLFYDEQFSHPEFVQIVESAGSNRQRLMELQRQYLLELFDGMPGPSYVEGFASARCTRRSVSHLAGTSRVMVCTSATCFPCCAATYVFDRVRRGGRSPRSASC